MRYLLFFLIILASCASSDLVQIEVAVTPAQNTRICLVRRVIAVIDDLGNEHRAPERACNEGLITLPEGRTMSGIETTHHEFAEHVFMYVVP